MPQIEELLTALIAYGCACRLWSRSATTQMSSFQQSSGHTNRSSTFSPPGQCMCRVARVFFSTRPLAVAKSRLHPQRT